MPQPFLHAISLSVRDFTHRISRKLKAASVQPWMKNKELEIINGILDNLKPMRCLEWGAGFSTLYFTNRLPEGATWLSIEHNAQWFNEIKDKNRNPGVTIVNVVPDNVSYTNKDGDGSYEDFKTYIDYPSGKFDFIFIDGRARKQCLKRAMELIEDNGVVIVHDANRKEYFASTEVFKQQLLLRDYRKGRGGIWVGSKQRDLSTLLDISFHESVWKHQNRLAKMMFMK